MSPTVTYDRLFRNSNNFFSTDMKLIYLVLCFLSSVLHSTLVSRLLLSAFYSLTVYSCLRATCCESDYRAGDLFFFYYSVGSN